MLVDDHPIVRYGFAQLLAAEADIELSGQVGDARAAEEALEASPIDVMVLDLSLGTTNGLDLIRALHERHPEITVLVVSMHDELLYAERVLRAGAAGYVMKEVATEVLVRAIRQVASGGMFVSEAVSSRILHRIVTKDPGALGGSLVDKLSDRELHVLELMGRGFGTREISQHLHISIKTVESYRARLKDKMNLRSGTELLRFAVRWVEDK